jgi:hypothetical protein
MAVRNPYGSLGPSPATVRKITPPKPAQPAWKSLQGQMQNVFGGDPYAGEQAAVKYGWSQGLANDSGFRAGMAPPAASGRWITPDYSGILGSFTADARARFGAGVQAMEAQRLSGAKSAINRLGIRDVPGMLEKMKAFGLTQADLQGAADNPWSELKALDKMKADAWGNSVAKLASQGGYRSGGTINARQTIDQEAARNEAQLTQQTLEELSQGQFQKANWEREQRDQMEQAIAQQQASLAAAYQPYWSEQ